jgi:hypothetical protein
MAYWEMGIMNAAHSGFEPPHSLKVSLALNSRATYATILVSAMSLVLFNHAMKKSAHEKQKGAEQITSIAIWLPYDSGSSIEPTKTCTSASQSKVEMILILA